MQVREQMSTDLATVAPADRLQTTVDVMLDRGVGSVIVCDDDRTPVGIVTKSDVLRAASAEGLPLDDIPVQSVMSRPLETIQPGASVQTALDRLQETGIKRLVVLDGLELEGIITLTDIAKSLPELVSEVRQQYVRRNDWTQE